MKKINIPRPAYHQMGFRLSEEMFIRLVDVSLFNKCSVADTIRFILEEEVKNYE